MAITIGLIATITSLFLAMAGLVLCIEIIIKSSKKLKTSMIFLAIALGFFALHPILDLLGLNFLFNKGYLFNNVLHIPALLFIFLALIYMNNIFKEIADKEKIRKIQKEEEPKKPFQEEKIKRILEGTKETKIKKKKNHFSSISRKIIITKEGKRLGVVKDIIFETKSGELIDLIVKDSTLYTKKLNLERTNSNELLIPYSAIIAISDFVIISEEDLIES